MMREGGGIGEGRKGGMTGLNLKRLSLIPSGGKERGCVAAFRKFVLFLPHSSHATYRACQRAGLRREGEKIIRCLQ